MVKIRFFDAQNTIAFAKKTAPIEDNLHQYLTAVGAQGESKFLRDDQLQADYHLQSLSYIKSGY